MPAIPATQKDEAEGSQVRRQPEQLGETLPQKLKKQGLGLWLGSRALA